MNFLQFYRHLLSLLSTEGVYRAIATFQALLRQEPFLLHFLKQYNWDTAALRILGLENLEYHNSHTEIELHCALMNLLKEVELSHRLDPDAKASFYVEARRLIESAPRQNEETQQARTRKLLSERYSFSPITIDHLIQIGTLWEFKKKKKILIGDDSKHKIAVLLKGAVRGYYKMGAKKVTFLALVEGAVIADFSRLFDHNDEYRLIFECFEDCEILVFDYADLALKQVQYHEISLDTQKFLEAQLIESLVRLKFLILNDGKQRVKALNGSDRSFLQRFNRKDMACYIALTPEAFARISKGIKESQRKTGEEKSEKTESSEN